MKNKLILVNLILIAFLSISTISLGFSIDMEMDKTKDLKVDDEVIYSINLNEKIIGASFKINYDISNLKLVDSESENLYVSENNGQVACVYLDIEDKGTDTLKIKFKVLNTNIANFNFSLNEAKFVTLENQSSYEQNDIEGITKIITIEKSTSENIDNTNKNENNPKTEQQQDNTTITNKIPQTGTSDIIFILIGITGLMIIYHTIKLKRISK